MEKKLRARTIRTVIACAIMFLAISSLVGYITWAAVTGQFELGGNITFTATGVEATVTKTDLTGATAEGKFTTLVFNPNQVAPDNSSWKDLNLQFDENATDIVLTFTIKNDSTKRKLNVVIEETNNDGNMTITIAQSGGTENNDAKNVTIDTETTATYTVTFHVEDKTQDVNATNFKLAFTLTTAEA